MNLPKLHRRRATGLFSRGFTLVEITITLALTGVIMATIYAVLFGTLKEKQIVELKVMGSRIGPLLLDQVERDLRQLFSYNLASGAVYRGKDDRVSGYDADRILMVSYTPSTSPLYQDEKWVFSAVNEVGYVLTENPDNPDFMILWRREDYHVDDKPLEGGKGTPLYRRVTRFNVTYYDETGEDADDAEEWDSEELRKLPAAIRLDLTVEVEPRARGVSPTPEQLMHQEFHFTRWITFPPDQNLTIAVRPALPVKQELDESGDPITGQGGDGKGDGEGDEDDPFGGPGRGTKGDGGEGGPPPIVIGGDDDG